WPIRRQSYLQHRRRTISVRNGKPGRQPYQGARYPSDNENPSGIPCPELHLHDAFQNVQQGMPIRIYIFEKRSKLDSITASPGSGIEAADEPNDALHAGFSLLDPALTTRSSCC